MKFNELYESLLSEATDKTGTTYAVIRIGGNDGNRTIDDAEYYKGKTPNPDQLKNGIFSNERDAKRAAYKKNKELSRMQKEYYGLWHVVAKLDSDNIFTGEQITFRPNNILDYD